MISASFGTLAAAQQHQPAKDPDREQIEEPERHGLRSCPSRLIWPNRRSHPLRRVLTRYRCGLPGHACQRAWSWSWWDGNQREPGVRQGPETTRLSCWRQVVSGGSVLALYRCRALARGASIGRRAVWRRRQRGLQVMAEVACFCGCLYSFDGGAGDCPKCGEYASVTAASVSKSAQPGQQGQSLRATNGNGQNGRTADGRDWAEPSPEPWPASRAS